MGARPPGRDREPSRGCSAARGTRGSRARDLRGTGTGSGQPAPRDARRDGAECTADGAADPFARNATFVPLRRLERRPPVGRIQRGVSCTHSRGSRVLQIIAPFAAVLLALSAAPWVAHAASPAPTPATPAGMTMDARVLVQGHARTGSWMAIRVDLANDGPAFTGELRLLGGTQGRTRFAVPVDLPTTSRKAYVLHAQSPAFGAPSRSPSWPTRRSCRSEPRPLRSTTPASSSSGSSPNGRGHSSPHSAASATRRGPSRRSSARPSADLPDRPEAWSALDRLVWQDVDAGQLSAEQPAAHARPGWRAADGSRSWAASGGLGLLAGFPDELLPYRPVRDHRRRARDDPRPARRDSLPRGAEVLPALAGRARRGHPRPRHQGDRTIGADRPFGSGAVTLVGIDPPRRGSPRAPRRMSCGPRSCPPADLPRAAHRRRRRDRRLAPRHAPGARPPADRGPPAPHPGLHPPHRPGELPGPPAPRPARVGMGDDAAAGRRVHRRGLRDRGCAPRHGRDRQPDRLRPGRARHRRGAGPGLPRRLLADPRLVRHQPPRRSAALRAVHRRRASARVAGRDWTLSRAIPPACASSTSATGRQGRARRGARQRAPHGGTLRLADAGSSGRSATPPTADPRQAAVVLGTGVRRARRPRPRGTPTSTCASLPTCSDGPSPSGSSASRCCARTAATGRSSSATRSGASSSTHSPTTHSSVNGTLPADGPVLLAWGAPGLFPVEVAGPDPRVTTGETLYYLPLRPHGNREGHLHAGPDAASLVEATAQFFNKDPYSLSSATAPRRSPTARSRSPDA